MEVSHVRVHVVVANICEHGQSYTVALLASRQTRLLSHCCTTFHVNDVNVMSMSYSSLIWRVASNTTTYAY